MALLQEIRPRITMLYDLSWQEELDLNVAKDTTLDIFCNSSSFINLQHKLNRYLDSIGSEARFILYQPSYVLCFDCFRLQVFRSKIQSDHKDKPWLNYLVNQFITKELLGASEKYLPNANYKLYELDKIEVPVGIDIKNLLHYPFCRIQRDKVPFISKEEGCCLLNQRSATANT